MHDPILTIRVWGFYAMALGIVLATIPNLALELLGVHATDEVWIRVLGVVTIGLGIVYYGGARGRSVDVVKATIWDRVVVVVGLIVLWIAGGPWQLVIFALVELVGIAWTWQALRSLEPRTV